MKFFLPKQLIFFDLLRQLNNYSKEIALLFEKFVASFEDFEKYSQQAKEIEHKADTKTHEIINKLNKTFITPFDREDIYLLTHELDDIVDLIENVIHNIDLYQIRKKKSAIDKFAKLITEASVSLGKLIDNLQEQKYTPYFNELMINLHDLEDQGDLVFQEAISRLFKEEKDPILVIKWKEILENLEMTMDKYQRVSDVIEGIIVKSG